MYIGWAKSASSHLPSGHEDISEEANSLGKGSGKGTPGD